MQAAASRLPPRAAPYCSPRSPSSCVKNLWRMFKATDATMLEINPLAETPEGNVFVCDAKINFDDNAAFRQADIFSKRDFSQEDAREVEASKHDLNYIGAQRMGVAHPPSPAPPHAPPLVSPRRPGRLHRLHGQWRGPGHGDHGHYQAARGRARQLSRRWRRSVR